MRELCEKRVVDLVIVTRMQQGILGFVKRNCSQRQRESLVTSKWVDVIYVQYDSHKHIVSP